jgi:pimeloyl-ACP methyl ester carboxylesterase
MLEARHSAHHSGLDAGSTGDGVCVSNRIDRLGLPDVTGVRHRQVACRGLSFHIAEAGDGEPLVLLHGWPQNWYCWRRVVPLLPGRRLIMPDLRGHGWSNAPREGYEKENLVDDVLALMDTLNLDVVGLVGHDWGGWTGFLAALRAPERFSALLALGIVHPFQTPTLATALQAWRGAYQLFLASPVIAQAALRASPRFVAAAISAATARNDANSDAERRFYGEVLQDPARSRATTQLYRTFLLRELPHLQRYHTQRLQIPTRLLIGDRDPIGNAAMLSGWQPHADDMAVEIVPSAGHFLPEEAPLEVVAAINALFGVPNGPSNRRTATGRRAIAPSSDAHA